MTLTTIAARRLFERLSLCTKAVRWVQFQVDKPYNLPSDFFMV